MHYNIAQKQLQTTIIINYLKQQSCLAQNWKTKSGEDNFTFQDRTKPWGERKNILLRKQKHVKLWVVIVCSNLFIKLSSFFQLSETLTCPYLKLLVSTDAPTHLLTLPAACSNSLVSHNHDYLHVGLLAVATSHLTPQLYSFCCLRLLMVQKCHFLYILDHYICLGSPP